MCNIISDYYINKDVKIITPKDNFNYFCKKEQKNADTYSKRKRCGTETR